MAARMAFGWVALAAMVVAATVVAASVVALTVRASRLANMKISRAHSSWHSTTWRACFPGQVFTVNSALPPEVSRLRIFIYELSQSSHCECIARMERYRNKSNCDFMRSPCVEVMNDRYYSEQRTLAAEVFFLRQLMRMPNLVSEGSQADVFVVPYLMQTCAHAWTWDTMNFGGFTDMVKRLKYFKQGLQRRHIFLGTTDGCNPMRLSRDDRVPFWPAFVHKHQILWVHTGPRLAPPFESHDVVVPYAQLGKGRSFRPVNVRPQYFASFAGAASNRYRCIFRLALERMQHAHPELKMWLRFTGTTHIGLPVSQDELYDKMHDSLLCLVPPGDTPNAQNRFYDALWAGCVPVVVSSFLGEAENFAETFWYSNQSESTVSGLEKRAGCKTHDLFLGCGSGAGNIDHVYPFQEMYDLHKVVLKVPSAALHEPGALERFLLDQPLANLLEKKLYISQVRATSKFSTAWHSRVAANPSSLV